MKLSLLVIPPTGALIIGALARTWRFRVQDREQLARARGVRDNVVYAFWHGRLLPLIYQHRGEGACVLASEHHDGELLGRTIRFFGLGHVRGSSTRGGTKAILALAEASRCGHDVALTVDGPRGPRFQVKPGVIEVAKLTGCPIVPVTASSRRHRTFASWDLFELPAPFTLVVVTYGPPLIVPPDANREVMESKRQELEASLRRITDAGDRNARS